MMTMKKRKAILAVLIIYTLVIAYFMFFGFGRPNVAIGTNEYRFNLIPHTLPLAFPNLSDLTYFHLWLFNFGNLAAYIPFGILIPLLYPVKFPKFISLFIFAILILETVQMLTFLGSFDINDAIVNTLGAAVGFFAYKLGCRYTEFWKKWSVTAVSAAILSVGVIGFSEILTLFVTQVEGPVVALNVVENSDEAEEQQLHNFEIGYEKIEPAINVFGNYGKNISRSTYTLEGKDIILSLHYGVPDDAADYNGRVRIYVDGSEVDILYMDAEYRYPSSAEMIMENVDELTIIIEGEAKLWDVTFKELNYWWN